MRTTRRRTVRKTLLIVAGAILALVVASAIAFFAWYQNGLQPVDRSDDSITEVVVESGMNPSQIGDLLKEKDVIRSATVFNLYTSWNRVGGKLQAGKYELSRSQPLSEIVNAMVTGAVTLHKVTFLPGATLAENRAALIDAGFPPGDVDRALAKTYTGVLFTDKPANTDLEGYLYGDTYFFSASTSVETILEQSFAEYTEVITQNDLIAKFSQQGLSLYEGITLASIVQREVYGQDQAAVAQVFYNRLAIGMMLGSDVTYEYAAKKLGVTATPNLESPYNTRKYAGLPPGPIAVPGKAALLATASPSPNDYLYFLSGDDDVTYFAKTNTQHELNIVNHCQQKCLLIY